MASLRSTPNNDTARSVSQYHCTVALADKLVGGVVAERRAAGSRRIRPDNGGANQGERKNGEKENFFHVASVTRGDMTRNSLGRLVLISELSSEALNQGPIHNQDGASHDPTRISTDNKRLI